MEKVYEDLYIAIWRQAIQDETKKAVETVCGYAFKNAYADYHNATVEPLAEDSKEIKKIKRAIRKQAKMLCERLMPRIRQLVYAESKDWPGNRYKTTIDPEYKEMFKELKKEAVAFAVDKMSDLASVGDEV